MSEQQGRPVIVSGGADGMVGVWDLDSGEPVLGPFTGHGHGVPFVGQDYGVNAVAVGERQGRPVIVSGGNDSSVRVWDLETERHATLRIKLQHRVLSVAAIVDRLAIGTGAELLQIDLL